MQGHVICVKQEENLNSRRKVPKSYVEIEITEESLNVLERAGDGKIRELANLLESYGLRLNTRVDSPCG